MKGKLGALGLWLLALLLVAACGGDKKAETLGKQLQQVETGRKATREASGFVKENSPIQDSEGPQEFTVKTSDDWEIKGTYYRYSGKRKIPVILMLHEEGGSREDWRLQAEFLYEAGFGILNIDFRGHGQSTSRAGAKVGYQTFTEADWQGLVTDARAVLEFVQKDEAVDIVRIGIFGSKIGANVALKVLNLEKDLRAAVVVTARDRYRGIDINQDIVLREHQNVLVMAGNVDTAAADFARKIYDTAITTRKTLEIYDTGLEGLALVREMHTNGLMVLVGESSWGSSITGSGIKHEFDKLIIDFVIRNI